jgi:hypothetical protein
MIICLNVVLVIFTIGTPLYLVHVFEYKLSIALDLPFSKVYHTSYEIPQNTHNLLLDAIRHQNILGWDKFLCGYTSIYRHQLYSLAHSDTDKVCNQWDSKLIKDALQLYRQIWADRNDHLHGSSRKKAQQKLRERIVNQIRYLYNHPPRLHKRYSRITRVPIDIRLRGNTTTLQQWLSHINHQQHMSRIIFRNQKHKPIVLGGCLSKGEYKRF